MFRLTILIFIFVLFLTGCSLNKPQANVIVETELNTNMGEDKVAVIIEPKTEYNPVFPVDDFQNRITKKRFGEYITQNNSPIKQERFNGYHTGVDVEYEDVKGDVLVRSVADGVVIYSGWVSGYGGVIIINHNNYTALYGHVKQLSSIKKNVNVRVSEQIGTLGDGKTMETDNERKHLHFGIYKGQEINFRGYVQSEDELMKWLDPLKLYD
jgi:murein DD-endopeptidase MepM/ murein hydrolase activator NlpD